jgi:type I restriction enzyme M protein
MRDKDGNLVIKNGKVQPDITLRDTENIPLSEEIDKYFEREILPYIPDAWIDKKKIKVGYEIPMTRYFYKFPKVESASEIARRLERLEAEIAESLKILFHTED